MAKKEAPQQYQFAVKPEEKPGWEGFKQFLYNPETSEFLGRTGSSWFKIGLFYVVYYAFLTGFFIGMLVIFYQTLDDKQPKWLNSNGIIGSNPGVGYRPKPADDRVESTLVQFRHGTDGTWKNWVDRLDSFLEVYRDIDKEAKPNANRVECSFAMDVGQGQYCKVKTDELITGDCTKKNNYGFKEGKPCILIKLNKIYGWKPEPTEVKDLPVEMPEELVKYINNTATEEEKNQMIWFSCEGENPADKEHIGPIVYYPKPGVPIYHYPYENQEGYRSPAVFAHFSNPKHGVLISVTCKAWAKNIKHDYMERRGTTHFELMID